MAHGVVSKEKYLKRFGRRVKELRLAAKISQAELANRIGKDQQSIQRLEAGKINPSLYYLFEVAGGLNMYVEDLVADL